MTAGIGSSVPLVGMLASQAVSGTAFASYTTAKSVINAGAVVTLPPNFLYAGHYIRVTALMGISNVVTAQCQFTFQVMVGSVIAWTSGAISASTTAHVNLPAKLVVDLRVDSVGAGTAAKMLGVGVLSGIMFTSGAVADGNYGSSIMVPATAPAVGTGYDSTVSNALDFWVGIQTSNAGNGVQVFNYYVEDLT